MLKNEEESTKRGEKIQENVRVTNITQINLDRALLLRRTRLDGVHVLGKGFIQHVFPPTSQLQRQKRSETKRNNLNTNSNAAIWYMWTKKVTVIGALPDWVLTYLVNFVRSINNIYFDFFMKISGRLQLLRGLETKTSSILLVKYMFRRGHLS